MRIAFVTKHFLEPTHHAIRMILNARREQPLIALARRFDDCHGVSDIERGLVVHREPFRFGDHAVDLAHVLFDGSYSLRAIDEAAAMRLPRVLSFHGGFDTHVILKRDGIKVALRQILRPPAVVTVPSEADMARIAEVVPDVSCRLIRVPILRQVGSSGPSRRKGALLVCRLIERKGVDVVLEAIQLLKSRHVHIDLRIVGDGPLRPALERQCHKLGIDDRVAFVGAEPLATVLTRLSAAQCLVHPGRVARNGDADGVPQVILWAQAAGTVVIACDAGSVREIVEHDVTGVLVPPETPGAIAEAISRIIDDASYAGRLVENATEVVARHELSSVRDNVDAVYREAINAGGLS